MGGIAWIPTIITAVLTSFSFVSWIVLMAGVGSFQSWMDDLGVEEPGRAVSYPWWVVWFALPLIVASVAAAVMKHPSVLVRPLALLFAVEFTKLTLVVEETYKVRESLKSEFRELPSKLDSRLGAMLAGGIMLSMGTLAMTVWLAVLDALPVPPPAGREAAAPGHAAAGAPAGGYAVTVPNATPAGGYNYGTPGVMNYTAPKDAVPTAEEPGALHVAVGAPDAAGVPSPGGPPPNPPPQM